MEPCFQRFYIIILRAKLNKFEFTITKSTHQTSLRQLYLKSISHPVQRIYISSGTVLPNTLNHFGSFSTSHRPNTSTQGDKQTHSHTHYIYGFSHC